MTSHQIRQSFLDFFKGKQHTVVPSSSLLPDSPNLLFTNAGMNQFVPIFLGQTACPYTPGRAADTQKCIRAGGKHNDLDDVGLDTYHHTFFEMLGNWSFGDYFKKDAIAWAWELIIEVWKFPAERVYTTIYQPDKGDPADRDQEAWDLWAAHFRSLGLDPEIHIVNGNKKDNFWMMGDTGPCGPCTEIHIDLTPGPVHTSVERQIEGAKLVNGPDARCIEIWNNVFIQYNANPDGTFSPLPAQHVDTGMGFERVVSIIHGTKNFTDFENAVISNYETDVFRPLFDELEKMSGLKYGSTLPAAGTTGESEQEKIDVSFRVIADHIRTLSFAIADGISPGNNDRNYVLRRILRRAVRYGRTLGFKEPFFYKLVPIVVQEMGGVFPELRTRQKHIEETLKREEESFNKTLDKGITLFEAEAGKLLRGTHASSVPLSASSRQDSAPGVIYSKRNLPHYERPHAIYHVTFATHQRRVLSPASRSIVLQAIRHFDAIRYTLFAVCIMPDHVHLLFQPLVKEIDAENNPLFWSLTEVLHSIKSFTANEINKVEGKTGEFVWDKESHDRIMRSDADVEEKFHYICRNPWTDAVVSESEAYEWIWTWLEPVARQDAVQSTLEACAPQIAAEFAFKLYDEQGFPLDLTELMARERGLTVDVTGFEKLMEEQRNRARAAQKKTVIALSEIETKEATHFLGYDHDHTGAQVLEVLSVKDKTAVILNNSVCYAEMGGQVGDMAELSGSGQLWRIANTQKSGNTWLHFLDDTDAPAVGDHVTLTLDRARRAAIQRHHSVTHLLHWALHEVVSLEATQKGSAVGPDKLTFDFNSGALTPIQERDIERLVNEKIVENAAISWNEVPYAEVKGRPDIMQFFGDKYGDVVRVVDIGGYSKELCAGTHARSTGEIGLFRILSEAAVAAGVRRIEAVAGLSAYETAITDSERLKGFAAKLNSPLAEIEKKLDALLLQQKELEKSLKAAQQREAASRAKDLLVHAETINGTPTIIANVGTADGDTLQTFADALKAHGFTGVVLLGGVSDLSVALVASVSSGFTSKLQAGKIIQTVAPIIGGKGGGRPDSARGGGPDPAKLDEALAHARTLIVS